MNGILVLTLVAIVVSLVAGFKFNVNSGIIAMGFAFLIGVVGMGMKVNTVIGYWPTLKIYVKKTIKL